MMAARTAPKTAPTKATSRTKSAPRVKTAKNAKSIQADAKRSGRSYVASLNDETKKFAYNHGVGWTDDDVSALLNLMEDDKKTTYEMAISLGRTFYAAQVARSHVAFASRHASVFKRYL